MRLFTKEFLGYFSYEGYNFADLHQAYMEEPAFIPFEESIIGLFNARLYAADLRESLRTGRTDIDTLHHLADDKLVEILKYTHDYLPKGSDVGSIILALFEPVRLSDYIHGSVWAYVPYALDTLLTKLTTDYLTTNPNTDRSLVNRATRYLYAMKSQRVQAEIEIERLRSSAQEKIDKSVERERYYDEIWDIAIEKGDTGNGYMNILALEEQAEQDKVAHLKELFRKGYSWYFTDVFAQISNSPLGTPTIPDKPMIGIRGKPVQSIHDVPVAVIGAPQPTPVAPPVQTKSLAEYIKTTRKTANLTQEAFGALFNESQRQISRYEKSDLQPHSYTLLRLCVHAGVTPEELMQECPEARPIIEKANDSKGSYMEKYEKYLNEKHLQEKPVSP